MDRRITASVLVAAYRNGIFPMAVPTLDDEIYWFSPDPRAVIPLDRFRIPRSVRQTIRRAVFRTTTDHRFDAVLRSCAARDETWISDEIIRLYEELHQLGLAHSIECWNADDLVGGLYGVAIGAAFFGESMFYRTSGASKVALVDLVGRLQKGGYRLLDTQYLTEHLRQFGAVEIDRRKYLELLSDAVDREADWPRTDGPLCPKTRI